MEKYWNRFRLWIRKVRPKLAPTQIIAIVFAPMLAISIRKALEKNRLTLD